MRSLLLSFALVCSACGASPAAVPRTSPVAVQAPAAAPSAAPAASSGDHVLGDHVVTRSAVSDVVSHGLGAFLQRIELDGRPVRIDGKFHGFRVAALHDDPFWRGVDLKPGDVVTSVNGLPIERPEQAQTVFDSLEVASELRIAYERDGQPRELVYAIVEK
jgi:type II secretion system protein C